MHSRPKIRRAPGQAFKAGFLNGLGEAVSIVGTKRDFPRVEQDPSKALAGDWKAVGDDMRRTFEHAASRGAPKR